MSCFLCKGRLEDKKTTFMVDLCKCIIIVRDVPSQVCRQCGDVTYSDEVARRLDAVVDSMRDSLAEIAVVSYNSRPAA